MLLVKIVIASTGLLAIFLISKRLQIRIKRRHLLDMPFPDEWVKIIRKNVPLYNRIPETLKKQLHGLINIFLAEKNFEGCGGLEITDEIKVTIATQACILLLNRKTSYFRKLHTILVYPHTYIAKTISSNDRIIIEGHDARLGESWQNGPVVLAWDSVTGGTSNIHDARNVVIHEFAHQLDQEDGSADGAPILEKRSRYITWAKVLSEEYETLQREKEKHIRSVLNKYGATNPAEFFAVATETFFEKPKQMKKKHQELYDELRNYYKLDPAKWMETN